MVAEKEDDLLNLIEVMTKEVSSVGVMCHELRWDARLKQRELSPRYEEVIRLYDEALRKAVERIGSLIHLATERVNELTGTHASIRD